MKIAGSGFICQRHGSAVPDPDPHQNIMDPQNWSPDKLTDGEGGEQNHTTAKSPGPFY
jgi:hypothetical protein